MCIVFLDSLQHAYEFLMGLVPHYRQEHKDGDSINCWPWATVLGGDGLCLHFRGWTLSPTSLIRKTREQMWKEKAIKPSFYKKKSSLLERDPLLCPFFLEGNEWEKDALQCSGQGSVLSNWEPRTLASLLWWSIHCPVSVTLDLIRHNFSRSRGSRGLGGCSGISW